MSFLGKIFGSDKLLVIWISAKNFWVSYFVLSLLTFVIILWVGLSNKSIVEETGVLLVMFFHPLILYGVSVIGNIQSLLLIYVSYLLGKKRVDRLYAILACLVFFVFGLIFYYVALFIVTVFTNTFEGNSVLFYMGAQLSLIGLPIYAGLLFVAYHIGASNKSSSAIAVRAKNKWSGKV